MGCLIVEQQEDLSGAEIAEAGPERREGKVVIVGNRQLDWLGGVEAPWLGQNWRRQDRLGQD